MPVLPSVLFSSVTIPIIAGSAAFLAIAIPVTIHLLNRQRVRVLDWAAMRFLMAAQKRHHRRIDQWVLLAARILALAIPLAGMCAVAPWAETLWQRIQPGDPETIVNAPRTHHILVVDTTCSMNAVAEPTTRFDLAIQRAEEAIRAANPGDGFSLFVLAGSPQLLVPGPSHDADKLIAELQALKPTDTVVDHNAALSSIADLLTRSPVSYPRRQVLIISDLQRSAWGATLTAPENSTPEGWDRILARGQVAFVDVGKDSFDNIAVTDVTLPDPLPFVNAPSAVVATLQNFGSTDRRLVRVELAVGRPNASGPDLFPVEQRVIDSIPAGEQTAITFALEGVARFNVPGVHILQVRLVDSDDLPSDDTRALAVNVRDRISAVLVNGRPSTQPLRRASEYLQEALAPGGRVLPGNPARPRTISLEEFADASLSDLTEVDCVFLCDVPSVSPAQVARLEALLKRGGGVVIGLGPNALANADLYNRLLYADGKGLLPGKIVGTRKRADADDPGYRFFAEESVFRTLPLAAFADDNSRAGLTSIPFHQYVQLELPEDSPARRLLSFVSSRATPDAENQQLEPALLESTMHRGKVMVLTTTLNTEWNDWPRLPSYLPFAHELLRYVVSQEDRHTLEVGEGIEEYVPLPYLGLTANITGPQNTTYDVPVLPGDDIGLIRLPETSRAGLYRIHIGDRPPSLFVANIAASAPGGGSESDLRRLDVERLREISPAIQIVQDPTTIQLTSSEDGVIITQPRPHGPRIARWLVVIGLAIMIAEILLAWRMGPGRASVFGRAGQTVVDASSTRMGLGNRILRSLAWIPLALALAVIGTLIHAETTGQFLGFLPDPMRMSLERSIDVPEASPGEGTRWRLEHSQALPGFRNERMILSIATLCALGLALLAYGGERNSGTNIRRLLLPWSLRAATLLLVIWIVLPQTRIAFDREGWPDVVILIDSSGSMGTVDDLQDPEVRAKAEELAAILKLTEADRLALAKALLIRPDGNWIHRLLTERQVKVHLYSIGDQARLLAALEQVEDATSGHEAVQALAPTAESSLLGDNIQAVLKSFRGGSLAAMIVLTDGITTAGDDLPAAGRAAARANVPLFLVGLGDHRDPLDMGLSDLRADEVVAKNDELVFEFRLTARGPNVPRTTRVILSEKQGERKIQRAETTVIPDPSGKPVSIRLQTVPTEIGEKTYVIEVPPAEGETDTNNNTIERMVVVTDNKQLRVLYIEGYPRYEFRFVKVLLERETETGQATYSFNVNTLLLDASKDHFTTDRSALRGFPTRSELFEYDVIILGDVNPEQLPRSKQTLQDLADFVRERGGGLLVCAGEQNTPSRMFDTPLADVLPILPADDAAGGTQPIPERTPLTEGYTMRLTPIGGMHPLFRFATDEADSARIWNRLKPMLWHARGYVRKQSAEVLATHPDRPAEDRSEENHPLVLQQFVGAGRVLFFGFDETWRWRYRSDEEQFNKFWRQTVRVLARNRVSRTELRTDKQTPYRRDEPITITVRFPDDAPPPAEDGVRVMIERSALPNAESADPDRPFEQQKMTLSKVEGTRATFQGLQTRTPEGQYRIYLDEPTVLGTRPRAEVTVLPPAGELDRLEPDRIAMIRAAGESRGKSFTLATADQVLDELPDGVRIPLNQPCPPYPLWNHVALFGLIAALLGAEWIVRRRERLL